MNIKLPEFIEVFLVKVALSKGGPYLQKGLTLAAAYLVSLLADKIPGLENVLTQEVIIGLLWVVIDNLYGLIPADIIKRYGKEIQGALVAAGQPVKVDGLPLSKTASAITEMASTVSTDTAPKKVAVPSHKRKKYQVYPGGKPV